MNHPDDLLYYSRVVRNGHSLSTEKVPIITTIHASKGREADNVVLFSEMGRRCWQDPDSEHRLAYVGSTRTRRNLTICLDRKVEWARMAYDYPLG
jgi:superfamily I DNA/RNA helicase